MNASVYRLLHILGLLLCISLSSLPTMITASGIPDTYERSSRKNLKELIEDVEFAITEQNLRIVERLHVGEAIRERGNEDFPDYEIILYCSLTFAEKILKLDPQMINACPGRITIRGKEDSYILSAQLWQELPGNEKLNVLIRDMNEILVNIIDHAILKWE